MHHASRATVGDLPEQVTQLAFGTIGRQEETRPTCFLHTHKERKGDTLTNVSPVTFDSEDLTDPTVDGSTSLTLHSHQLLGPALLTQPSETQENPKPLQHPDPSQPGEPLHP